MIWRLALSSVLPTTAMFKLPSLPQAIGLPFLSATEDAQLKFKTGPNGVKRLSGAEVIPRTDVAYWAQWYTLFASAHDVYSLLGAHDIRHALHTNPANVATLVHHLAHHLFTLVPSPLFPHPPTATAQDLTKEALNCLRVLGRVLSVVYEAEGEGDGESFAAQYLWNRQKAPPVSPAPPADHFTIEDSDEDGDNEQNDGPELDTGARAFRATIESSSSPSAPISDPLTQPGSGERRDSGEDEYLPSLAERLFSCTIDLLFCAGFTLPQTVSEDQNDKINVRLFFPRHRCGIADSYSTSSGRKVSAAQSRLARPPTSTGTRLKSYVCPFLLFQLLYSSPRLFD